MEDKCLIAREGGGRGLGVAGVGGIQDMGFMEDKEEENQCILNTNYDSRIT